jgi:hypothetical protein
MYGRPIARRRPLLRAAAVGGTFAAGRAAGRRAGMRADADASQDARISALEASQPGAPPAAPADPPPADPAAPPPGGSAGAGSSVLDQLSQLTALHEQGALSDDEFAAAKAKVLGS